MSTPILTFNDTDAGVKVDIPKMLATGVLVQGSPDAGKSHLLRYIIEQTYDHVQQFIFDPEGEFTSLREKFDYVVVSASSDGDVVANPATARELCRQLCALGVSAILDVSELESNRTPTSPRETFVGLFLRELVNLPRSKWRNRLVVVDEVHEFAPQTGEARHPSLDAVILTVSKGRKRGIGSLFATQRISKLHKDAADIGNMLVGYTGREVDVDRAAKELGLRRETANELRTIPQGEFFALGPAISREMKRVRGGQIKTSHPKPGQITKTAPPAPAKVKAVLAKLHDLGEKAKEETNAIEILRRERDDARARVRQLEKGAPAPVPAGHSDKVIETAIKKAEAPLRSHIRLLEDHVAQINKEFSKTTRTALSYAQRIVEATETMPAFDMPKLDAAPAAAPLRYERTVSAESKEVRTLYPPVQIAHDGLTGPEQRILDSYATFLELGVERPSRTHVAAFANYHERAKSFVNAISSLRIKGLLDSSGYPTGAGRSAGRASVSVTDLKSFHAAWYTRLSGPEQRIMDVLLTLMGQPIPRDQLAEKVGYHIRAKSFTNAISHLRSLGLLDHEASGTYATPAMFPEGLR